MDSVAVSIGTLTGEGESRSMGPPTVLVLSGGRTSLDVPTADYVIEVQARWPQGEAPIYFLVRVA
jgi:hypothetical protein